MSPIDFQQQLLSWFDQQGRKNLPWQQFINPYRIWLSEIMLQQTQVATVIPYFQAFTEKFPDIHTLANASVDEVLQQWSGLGYYARARNLHKAAQKIVEMGFFPNTLKELTDLPGIGQSTAGAILSIAFNNSHPIMDGNVKRVLCRFKGIEGWPGHSQIAKQLWAISYELTPQQRVADYTQAIMDLGATVCTRNRPRCSSCPIQAHCFAHLHNCVSLLPTPKQSKVLPIKQLLLLVIKNNNGEILLEKRPPTGIWGGLWSLPEASDRAEALTWCAQKQISIIDYQITAPKRHTFSHYHLDYSPLLINANNTTNFVMESEQMLWYNAEQIRELGLATPIKNLLQEQLNNENNENNDD